MDRAFIFLVTLSVLTSGFCLAQTPHSQPSASPERDPAAIALIQQSLATMGLVASPTFDTIAEGTITSPDGTSQPIRIETAGLDRTRNDVGNGEFVFVTNAGKGFLIYSSAKSSSTKHHLRSWATQYKRPDHLPALSLMADVLNPSLQAKDVGMENVNGKPAYHLRLSMWPDDPSQTKIEDLLSEFHVYIDQASMLVVRTTTFDYSPEAIENRTPVDTFFSDYRNEGGVLVPFHLTRYIAGHNQSDIAFTSVSLNAAVPDSDFE